MDGTCLWRTVGFCVLHPVSDGGCTWGWRCVQHVGSMVRAWPGPADSQFRRLGMVPLGTLAGSVCVGCPSRTDRDAVHLARLPGF